MTTPNLKNSISRSPLPVGVQRVQRIWIIRGSLLIALGCFALSLAPNAFGVNPPPDGGYPGGNTAEGQNALLGLTSGGYNTAVGFFSLRSETAGSFNTAIGAGTLFENVGDPSTGSGEENTATGAAALLSNTIGSFNTANGAFALFRNSVGVQNTAIGSHALFRNIGNGNTATGESALLNNTTGFDNTAIGSAALLFNTTGASNIALGLAAGSGVSTANDVICIGTGGADVSYSCFIGNIRGTTTGQMDAVPVVIDSQGQLGTISSSRRFKREIKPMDQASEAILGLKPVTFHYKSDTKSTAQFGLIAEEVAAINPDLVVHDKDGEIYTVRYEAVNAMLLNEFLKEHRIVQEVKSTAAKQEATITDLKSTVAKQEALIAHQQKGLEVITASLKEQASQIQKVSARMEASGPAPQVVSNP